MSDVSCAYIVSTSMINALGESTAAVAAAIRANISAVAETQFLSQDSHPIKMANVDADYLSFAWRICMNARGAFCVWLVQP